MRESTQRFWNEQDRHRGDRLRLFSVVADAREVSNALYPGSFVDIAPSFVFSVTYVDTDRRAATFFADSVGVDEIIAGHRPNASKAAWRFISGDYTRDLGAADLGAADLGAADLGAALGPFDLLISLYAGFVSEHCTRYLRHGGLLLANPSHGDAAMASIDPRYRLAAVVNARVGRYTISTDDLDTYLIPKRPTEVDAELLHGTGHGIAYTRSPFAYLFERIDG